VIGLFSRSRDPFFELPVYFKKKTYIQTHKYKQIHTYTKNKISSKISVTRQKIKLQLIQQFKKKTFQKLNFKKEI
jgi:hypothetical protein